MIPAFVLALTSVLYAPPPNGNVSIHVGGGPQKLTREEAARKAVGVMAGHGFRYAGVDPDGHAWGYTDSVTVVVLVLPTPDGRAASMVCAAGWDNAEAERVRNTLRAAVLDGPADPDAPREVGTPVPQALRKSPPLRWRVQTRPGTGLIARYFTPVAALALEKSGVAPVPQGPTMVGGQGGGRVMICFACPGPNTLAGVVACVATAADEAHADTGCRVVLAEVVKILFE